MYGSPFLPDRNDLIPHIVRQNNLDCRYIEHFRPRGEVRKERGARNGIDGSIHQPVGYLTEKRLPPARFALNFTGKSPKRECPGLHSYFNSGPHVHRTTYPVALSLCMPWSVEISTLDKIKAQLNVQRHSCPCVKLCCHGSPPLAVVLWAPHSRPQTRCDLIRLCR